MTEKQMKGIQEAGELLFNQIFGDIFSKTDWIEKEEKKEQ